MSEIWGKLNGPTEIHLTGSVPGQCITKSRIRQQVWDFIEEHDLANFPRPVHKRIPNFKGAAAAGQLFASLPEFKKACVVKVNPDKPQEEVRYQVLDHKKTLLVPTPRLKSGLFNLLEAPGDSSKEEIRMLASRQGIDNNSKPVPLCYRAGIDIVVIGSVAVDKFGHRIGKGEGFADLEFALGVSTGSITDETIVVATVHDCQLFDSLPEEIFGEHDITVDIIVTPTTIHRVEERLPKPSKVIWEDLSVEKFKKVPILKQWKEEEERRERAKDEPEEEKHGSSEKLNTKVNADKRKDSNEKSKVNKDKTEVNEEKKESDKNKKSRNKRNSNREEKPKKDRVETDQNQRTNETKDMKKSNKSRSDVSMNGHIDDKNENKKTRTTKDKEIFDDRPLLFIGKIPKTARVRDLKDVLQERDVKPKQLVWKGFKGYAFLYFDVSEDIEKMYTTLEDLKIGDDTLVIQKEKYTE